MGFDLTNTVSPLPVFLQGILSFFSPCVLPLVPVYLSYLSGGVGQQDSKKRRKTLLVSTLFFIIGISFAFFILGLGASAIGKFFVNSRTTFSFIAGLLLILLGLMQLGLFGKNTVLGHEFRLPFRINGTMNPLTALLLGFTFSFAWTPCVGPALAGVLLMTSTAESATLGFLYIGLYTLGFVIPFLLLGIFGDALLGFVQKSKAALAWTTRIGAVLLILMGVLLLSGWVTSDTFQSTFPSASSSASLTPSPSPAQTNPPSSSSESSASSQPSGESSSEASSPSSSERPVVPAIDFTLTDQYGNSHTLSDYKGKVVFLNFWADWCGYCLEEMPDIQQLYLDNGENSGDVVIFGITYGLTQEEMADFFEERNLTYPTLLDTDQEMFAAYGAYSLPTTYMIDKEGNVYGYLPGMMTREIMDSIIQQTLDSDTTSASSSDSASSAS